MQAINTATAFKHRIAQPQPKKNTGKRAKNARVREVITVDAPARVTKGKQRSQGLPKRPRRPKRQPKPPQVPPPPPPPPAPVSNRPALRMLQDDVAKGGVGLGEDYSPSTIRAMELNPYDVAKCYMAGLLDPLNAPAGSVRTVANVNDIPCEANKYVNSVQLTIYNGGTTQNAIPISNGSAAFVLRGDTFSTIIEPETIGADHSITWTNHVAHHTYDPYSGAWMNRPVIPFAVIRVHQIGEPHVVTAYSYRISPATVATQKSAFPTATNVGVAPIKRMLWGGQECVVPTQGCLVYTSHMARGLVESNTWTTVGVDRGTSSFAATAIWLYGLWNVDRVEVYYGCHAVFSPTDSAAIYRNNMAVVPANPNAERIVEGAADSYSASGKDTVVDEKGNGPPAKVLPSVFAEVDKIAHSDVVQGGVNVVSNLLTGDLWGAAKGAYQFFSGIFSSPLAQPRRVVLDGKEATLPPVLLSVDYNSLHPSYRTVVDALTAQPQYAKFRRVPLHKEGGSPPPESKEFDAHWEDVRDPRAGADSAGSSSSSRPVSKR